MGLVAMTGCAGRIGTSVSRMLRAGGWKVRGLDRNPAFIADESIVAEISDRPALTRLCDGADALIHLAATPDDSPDPGWFENELVPINLAGLKYVLDAAAAAGIRRVVLASSGQVNWTQQYEGPLPVRAADPLTPRSWYAASKVWMEAAGYSYAHRLSAGVVAARLGWCPRKGQASEIASNLTAQDLYLSPGDAGHFFLRTIEADIPSGFHVVYASSLPIRDWIFDVESGMRLLGWQPRDKWPQDAETP